MAASIGANTQRMSPSPPSAHATTMHMISSAIMTISTVQLRVPYGFVLDTPVRFR